MAENEYKKKVISTTPNTVLPLNQTPPAKKDGMDSEKDHSNEVKKNPEMDSEHMNQTPAEVEKRKADWAAKKAARDLERKKRGLKIGSKVYGGGLNPAAGTGPKVSNV